MEGEDPWRLLATALEVAAAVKSGDPASFVSHLPVHQVSECPCLTHQTHQVWSVVRAEEPHTWGMHHA
jgi:DNA-directed RNA polymerase